MFMRFADADWSTITDTLLFQMLDEFDFYRIRIHYFSLADAFKKRKCTDVARPSASFRYRSRCCVSFSELCARWIMYNAL